MSAKAKLPLVAICGRPNVGKSTLFNRIIGKSRAIVHAEEGITRDRFYGEGFWKGRRFRIVDTGGIIEHPADEVTKQMQMQVRMALQEARVILFVVDGQQPITRVDHELRDELFKYGKPVVLAANKLDNAKLEENRYEFYALGMGDPMAVSSGHGLGMDELKDAICAHLPEAPPQEEGGGSQENEGAEEVQEAPATVTKVAIVGKPNVGKSSFINAILNEARVIVDEKPGTTRDAIDIEFRWNGKDYLFIDTAGMRKKAGIKKHVEHFSVTRALRAIRRADLCIVMMDAREGMSEQDKRIIGYARKEGAAMLFVWTKWDLIENKEVYFKKIADDIDLKMPHMKYIPYVTISNITRQRLFSTFEYIDRIALVTQKRIETSAMNSFIEEIKAKHMPPSQKGKHAKILYATQVSVKPTTIVLFVNQKRLFHFSYMRFIENQLREKFGFEGVPIHLELREGKPRK